jgi:hypothetical protein
MVYRIIAELTLRKAEIQIYKVKRIKSITYSPNGVHDNCRTNRLGKQKYKYIK